METHPVLYGCWPLCKFYVKIFQINLYAVLSTTEYIFDIFSILHVCASFRKINIILYELLGLLPETIWCLLLCRILIVTFNCTVCGWTDSASDREHNPLIGLRWPQYPIFKFQYNYKHNLCTGIIIRLIRLISDNGDKIFGNVTLSIRIA